MTNQEIIFRSSISLMKEGIINGTGELITIATTDADGNEIKEQIEMPEAIHTYAIWKANGRQVKKGEKAKAKINIWKYSPKTAEVEVKTTAGDTTTEEVDLGKMFMKTAFFFTYDQTEPITK